MFEVLMKQSPNISSNMLLYSKMRFEIPFAKFSYSGRGGKIPIANIGISG